MNIEIANRLAELRKARNLSQEQLAEQLQISRQAVSKWERAESSPDTDNLIALARFYQVSLDELLLLSPEAESDDQFAREAALIGAAAEGGAQGETHGPGAKPARGSVKWTWTFTDSPPNWRVFPYPVLVTFVFLLLGSVFDLWHPGWMLFLTVPIYYTAIDGDGFDLSKVPYPLLATLIYLIIGFAWDLWHPGWLLFLTIPLYYSVLGKMLGSGINMALIASTVVVTFALMGAMLGKWLSGWGFLLGSLSPVAFALIGVALVALGVWSSLRN